MPLFIVTGASGIGKTTALQEMQQHETKYICIEQDLLYFMPHDSPEALSFKRETILRMAKNISQIGLPIVLGAASIPEQFENTYERRFFSEIHYVALVCDDNALEKRMREGRNIADREWIQSSLTFNQWFKVNGARHRPRIDICDITHKTAKEVASIVDAWVLSILKEPPGQAEEAD